MISNAIGPWKLIMEQRDQVGEKALMKLTFLLSKDQNRKSYARSFEEECSVCHLRLKRWRLNKNIVRFDKKGFLNMYWVPFWKKSSENLLKWYHIYWLTLWNLIKNGHSREWMWYCYLACPKLENRVFQDMDGRISKDHGRRNGKIVF